MLHRLLDGRCPSLPINAYVIHCLSVDTRAMQGRLTCLAWAGNLLSSQVGLGTRKKSKGRSCSLKYLTT
jgi:hypothetical protein